MFNFIKNKINIFDKKNTKKEHIEFDHSNPVLRLILKQAEKCSSEKTFIFVKHILNLIVHKEYKKLKELCFSGLPDEIPLLRSLIWKINLGYLPLDINEWDSTLFNKREEYNYLKHAFSLKLHLEKKIYELNIIKKKNNNKIHLDQNFDMPHKEKLKFMKKTRRKSEQLSENVKSTLNFFSNYDKSKKIRRSNSFKCNDSRKKIDDLNNNLNFNVPDTSNNDIKKIDENDLYSNIEKFIRNIGLSNSKENLKEKKINKLETNVISLNFDNSFNQTIDKSIIITNKDRELIEDIYKDMRRTYSDFQFFLRPSSKKANQINKKDIENIIKRKSFNISSLGFQTVVKELNMEETHLDVIARILFVYSKTNNDVSYVQGMNEICALIYYVIVQEQEFKNFSNKNDLEVYDNKAKKKSDEIKKIYCCDRKNIRIKNESFNYLEKNIGYGRFSSATGSTIASKDITFKEFVDFEDFLLHTECSNQMDLNNENTLSSEQHDLKKRKHAQIKCNFNEFDIEDVFQKIPSNNNNKFMDKKDFNMNYDISDNTLNLKPEINNANENTINFLETFLTDYESDTFWCFTNIMEMIKFTYIKSEDDKEKGIFKKIQILKSALKSFDPSMYKLMEEKNIDLGIFTMRWFILLFCQDFTLPDVIRIWDIILFIEDDTDIFFKVFIFALSILSLKKNWLIKHDYVSFIMEMQNLYDINIETLIETYTSIHKNFSKKLKKIVK